MSHPIYQREHRPAFLLYAVLHVVAVVLLVGGAWTIGTLIQANNLERVSATMAVPLLASSFMPALQCLFFAQVLRYGVAAYDRFTAPG